MCLKSLYSRRFSRRVSQTQTDLHSGLLSYIIQPHMHKTAQKEGILLSELVLDSEHQVDVHSRREILKTPARQIERSGGTE